MRYTADGKPVTTFSMAVNDFVNNEKVTMWVKVTVWNRKAETANQYLKKGSKVLVTGRLQFDKETGGPRTWQDKNGNTKASFEITADDVTFISESQAQESPKVDNDSQSDDIPF